MLVIFRLISSNIAKCVFASRYEKFYRLSAKNNFPLKTFYWPDSKSFNVLTKLSRIIVKSEALCKRLIKHQWLIWPHSVQFSSVFKYNRWKKQTLRQYGRNCLQRKLRHTRWTNIWLQDWSSRVWTIWSMETISAPHNLDKKKYVPCHRI